MRQELMILRHNAYEAAANFHHAQGQYYKYPVSKELQIFEDALGRVRVTSEVHLTSLRLLLEYLQSSEDGID